MRGVYEENGVIQRVYDYSEVIMNDGSFQQDFASDERQANLLRRQDWPKKYIVYGMVLFVILVPILIRVWGHK